MSSEKPRVLYITSPNERCGIREHTEMLIKHLGDRVETALMGPMEIPSPALARGTDVVHIDHHAALHASWTRARVEALAKTFPVVVTQHDTFETRALMDERGLPDFSGIPGVRVVVHEGVEGYDADFIRQGVLAEEPPSDVFALPRAIGTAGFDLPWKGFDELARQTAAAGIPCLIISAGMSEERQAELQAINPNTLVIPDWMPARAVVRILAACGATAWLYDCGNSGTSGAIRLGLAARRPLILNKSCRQFRDLAELATEKLWPDSVQDLLSGWDVFETCWEEDVRNAAVCSSWSSRADYYLFTYQRLIKEHTR